MAPSQTIAIAAHLHVLLRRKTGRVTDTEWMAGNLEYALEIVRFARAKALEDCHPDLQEWADKLLVAVQDPTLARRPLVQGAMQALKQRGGATLPASAPPGAEPPPGSGFGQSAYGESGFADSVLEPGKTPKPRDPNAPRYVGGIR
jgi:hypothetical protein